MNMLDSICKVHDVPAMFKSMVPENPRNRLDVVNSKMYQNKEKRYIEIDTRVDLNPDSEEVFKMLKKLPSFIPINFKADYSFILRADRSNQLPERLLIGFYAATKK